MSSGFKIDSPLTGGMNGGTLVPEPFDYILAQYPAADTETYTYFQGGLGGEQIAIVTVVYTDATKDLIANVSRT